MNQITPAQIALEPLITWLTAHFDHSNPSKKENNFASLNDVNTVNNATGFQNVTTPYYPKPFDANWSEQKQVEWLIEFFNTLFKPQRVVLAHSPTHEPEYLPATDKSPAKILFAHGFFASALHEISHWCIAGKHRRTRPDFGYWYEPDGRNEAQQLEFERVEVKPQAIECLFTLMLQKNFVVSIDNLNSTTASHHSDFPSKVYEQVLRFIANPTSLPDDAQALLYHLHLALLSLSSEQN